MKDFFKEQATMCYAVVYHQEIDDPEEETYTKTKTANNIPFKAIVSNVKPEQLNWKWYGKNVIEAKQLIIENDKLSLLRLTNFILINGVQFNGYRVTDGQMAFLPLEGEDYTQVTVVRQ